MKTNSERRASAARKIDFINNIDSITQQCSSSWTVNEEDEKEGSVGDVMS